MDKLNKYLRRLKDHIANKTKFVGVDAHIDLHTNDKTQLFQKIFKTDGVTMFNSQKKNCKMNMKVVLSILLVALCFFVMPQNAYVAAEEEEVATIEKTVTVIDESSIVITGHPETTTVKENETATFNIEVSGDNYTYTWLYKAPIDEFTWAEVPSSMGTANGNTLTINNVTEDYEGYAFSCLVEGESSELSNAAYLYVENDGLNVDVEIDVKSQNYIVNGKYYKTIEEAYAALKADGTSGEIIVNQDVEDATELIVDEGYIVTLNTNGKNIVLEKYITNNGTLTIGGAGTIEITNVVATSNPYHIINNGVLNINTVTLYARTKTIGTDARINIDGGTIISDIYGVYIAEGTGSLTSGTIKTETNALVFESGATFNIYEGNIIGENDTTDILVVVRSSTLNMYGGTISGSNYYAISVSQESTLNITGGTVEGGRYAIRGIDTLSAITIGTEGEPISTTEPVIKGNIAIKSDSGFNFYDGILKAKETAISGTVVPQDGYGVYTTTEDGYETAYLKKLITDVTLSESSYIYDGNAKTPTVTVTWSGDTLVKETDYTVAYANNTAAGTATVTVSAVDSSDYVGTVTKEFTINKATGSVTVDNSNATVGTDETTTISYKYVGDGALTVSSSDAGIVEASIDTTAKTITLKGISKGEATVTINLAEGTNYTSASKAINVTVINGNYIVNNVAYETIEEAYAALKAAGTSGEIIVNKNVEDATVLKVEEGYTVTLNTNGNTITFLNRSSSNGNGIVNNGTLTINGGGTITTQSSNNEINYLIWNTGKELNVNNVTLINDTCLTGNCRVIQNNSNGIVNIYDGTIKGINQEGITVENDAIAIALSAGTLNIYSGDIISQKSHAVYADGGTVNVYGGNINSNGTGGYGVGGANCTITITGGTINGGKYGVRNSGGDITIGTKDGSISTESPLIIGGVYAVNAYNEFNFYDGLLLGGTAAYNKEPTGYETSYSSYVGTKTVDGVTYTASYPKKEITDVTLSESSYTYDGNAKTPTVTVTWSGDTLTKDTDYTVTYANNTEAGTATVTVSAVDSSDYVGTVTKEFTINKATGKVTLTPSSDSTVYGTSSVTFKAEALGGGTLSIGSKSHGTATINNGTVTLSGIENVAAETNVTVTVNAAVSDNYEAANATYTLTITRKEIAIPEAVTGLVYNGSVQTGVAEGTGYTIEGNTATDAGNHEATLTLDGNHAWVGGSIENQKISWSIDKATITATVNMTGYTYGETVSTPNVNNNTGNGTVTYYYNQTGATTSGNLWENIGSTTLSVGTYYMYAVIEETDNYYGDKTEAVLFRVSAASGITFDVELSPNEYTYDGTAKTPEVTVTLNGTPLAEGTDYEVEFLNNTKAGEASVVVTGKGNYEGSETVVYFTINKATANLTVNPESVTMLVGKQGTSEISFSGDGALSISSKDTSIATAVLNGNTITITGVKEGSTTIEVILAEGTNHVAETKEIQVTVEQGNYTVNNKDYDTLLAAYNALKAVSTSGEITVNKDVPNETTEITIEEGYNVTLNTNGKNIIRNSRIIVRGTLNITGDGTIQIIEGGTYNYIFALYGTLNIDGATLKTYIEGYDSSIININSGTIISDGTGSSVGSLGTVNMYNGTIRITSNGGSNEYVVYMVNGTFNMYGGEIIAENANSAYGVNLTGNAIFNLYDGTINAVNPYGVFVADNSTLNVIGGTITGTGGYAIRVFPNGTVNIGTSGDTVSIDKPEIISTTTYGIRTEGKVNFYDGRVTGTTAISEKDGATTTPETGYDIYTETIDGIQTAYLKKNITDVTLSESSYTYDGEAKTPSVTVTWSGDTLTKDTDYTVAYANNTNAGTATVTVTGINDYMGTVEKTFTIEKATVEIPEGKTLTYDVSMQTGVEEGEHYTLTGHQQFNAGNYTAVATLESSNYKWSDGTTGTQNIAWVINPKDINDLTITLSEDEFTYDGTAKTPTISIQSYIEPMLEGESYTLLYENNTNAGTATVTITGIGNYTGTVTKEFTISYATYTVTFNADGGSVNPTSKEVTYALTYGELPTPTKTGYTFTGWYTDGGTKVESTTKVELTEDHELTARWIADSDTKYTIYHYLENANDDGYTKVDTTTGGGTTGDTLTLADLAISVTNGTYSHASLTEGGAEATTTTIAADGTTEVHLYYTRNTYTLTLVAGENIASVTGTNTYKVGATVNISATLGSLKGYTITFNKWTTEDTVTIADSTAIATTIEMPAEDITITATSIKTANKYKVTFDAGEGTVTPTEKEVTYDSTYGELPTPTRAGYTFDKWVNENGEEITADTKVAITAEETLTATWTANTYEVSFDSNGGTEVTEKITVTYDGTYGELPTPERTGYTFKEWQNENGEVITSSSIVNITAAETLIAIWTANIDTKYMVYHYLENANDDGYTLVQEVPGGGTTGDTLALADLKTTVTNGTYSHASLTEGGAEATTTTIKADGTTEVHLYYTRNTYTLTLVAGENIASVTGTNTYKVGATIAISAELLANEEGYTNSFASWTSESTVTIANATAISTTIEMPASNVTVTANGTTRANTDTPYTVYHYLENANDDGYTKVNTENKGGTTGEILTLANLATTVTNGTYSHASLTEGGAEATTTTIKADGTTEVHLYYARNTYKLTVEKGTYITEVTGTDTYKVGETVEISATLENIAGYTYTFAGWTGDVTFEDATALETTLEMPAEDITITATAGRVANKYTITFDTDGGSEIAPITGDFGSVVTAPANPTKEGYTFAGWDKEIPATMPAENVTITAKWTVNGYTITFDTDGGSEIAPITGDFGSVVTAPADPTKTGYTFAGWDKEIPATMPAENVTITATWTVNKYTITFDTDGGSEIAPITQDFGTAVTAPANPTKTGYTFAGWDKEIPSTMPAENITITATWTVNEYTITFDTDGGSEIAAITQDYGTAVTAPADPTKEGYTFAGWDKEIPSTMPAENITITAEWTVNKYTITFDTDGGSEIAPITQDFGTTVTAPADPTKTGYTFAGWDKEIPETMPAENMTITAKWTVNGYTITFDTDGGSEIAPITGDFGSIVTAPADPTKEGYTFAGWDKEIPATMPAENITITAKWTVNQYTITFDTDGGSEIAPITQDFGTTVTLPADPTKTGYTFAGWDKEIPSTMPAENITITAKWTVNGYTITFDTDGGSEIAAITQDYGTVIEAPANPTKEGYTFAGWDTEVPSTMPAENITITAKWTVNQYTITFDTDGGSEIAPITGDFGSVVTAPADPTKDGFKFVGWDKEIPSTMPAENMTITAIWELNRFTVTLIIGDNVEEVIGTGSYDYGTNVSISAVLKEVEGYKVTFDKWVSSDENLIADIDTIDATFEMPAGNVELTATATLKPNTDTKYTVYHYLENANDDGYTLVGEADEKEGTTGATINFTTLAKVVENGTYSFGSIEENGTAVDTAIIAADGSTKVYLYYTRDRYQLTLNAGDNIESVTGGGRYKVGEIVTITASLVTDENGYTSKFDSWKADEGINIADRTATETTVEMPAANITITAEAMQTSAILIEADGTETGYAYIQDAINAANDDGNTATIIIVRDITLSNAITIGSTKNISLDLNGLDIIANGQNITAIINNGTLEVVDEIGTGEIIANGTNTSKTIINNSTLNITSGIIRSTLNGKDTGAVAIENHGTLTIGTDDGNISTVIPLIDSVEYGIQNVDTGKTYFNDGVIEGARNKSYTGSVEVPAGYDIITERIEDNRDKTTIGVDKVPPVLSGDILSSGWQKEYVEIEIEAYDLESGLRFVSVDNKEIELTDGKAIYKATKNKEYIIYAEDNASNSTSKSINVNTIDNVPPSIIEVTINENEGAGTIEVLVEVQDDRSGLTGIMLKETTAMPTVDDENWTLVEGYPTSKQSMSFTLDSGITYYFFAKDRVGNVTRYYGQIKAGEIDKVAPTIENVEIIKDEGKDYVSGKAVLVHVEATDNIAVSEILITDNSLTTAEARLSSDWKAYNEYVIHELPVSGDKIYTIYVWVKDEAGNISLRESTSAKLKAFVVGDNEFDYTGSDEVYNKTSLRFLIKDNNYNYDDVLQVEDLILRLTSGDKVLRNITNGLSLTRLTEYNGSTVGDFNYYGEIYELTMENLPGTGKLNLVMLDAALTDSARNSTDSEVLLTDIFVDNNPVELKVTNTGTYSDEGFEIRNIEAVDKEGYLINYIEVKINGSIETYMLTNGKAQLGLPDGAVITAYDKAGNEAIYEVTSTVAPEFTVSDSNIELNYGGMSETITYEYNGDGVVDIVSSDTNIANVSVDVDTKQVTISPVNAGNCEVTLRVLKTENYLESKTTINVTVNPIKVELEWNASEFNYDGTRKTVSATVTNAILNDEVLVIDYTENNRINAGSYEAKATKLSNSNYTLENAEATLSWKINKVDRNLTLDKTSFDMEMPLTKNITFTYEGEKANTIATSSNENVLTVVVETYDESGDVVVTPKTIGKATVTVTIPESTNYNKATATCEIEVIKKIRIFFDTQGGNEIDSRLVTYNRAYGELPTPTRTNYIFMGWNTATSGGTAVNASTIVSTNESHTLYAYWYYYPPYECACADCSTRVEVEGSRCSTCSTLCSTCGNVCTYHCDGHSTSTYYECACADCSVMVSYSGGRCSTCSTLCSTCGDTCTYHCDGHSSSGGGTTTYNTCDCAGCSNIVEDGVSLCDTCGYYYWCTTCYEECQLHCSGHECDDGHDYQETASSTSNCKKTTTYTCSRCGTSYKTIADAHVWTLSDDGDTICKNCGTSRYAN